MVIFEWNLIMGCLVWLFTFYNEWGNLSITLKFESSD
jgi:hypothetical protein